MTESSRDAAILWTGGKDSALAMYYAQHAGYDIRCLATFAPAQATFLAHPLSFITMQAEALALPHYVLPVSEPYAEGYELGLRWLNEQIGVNNIVTGDISTVDNKPNWIRERCRAVDLHVQTPLWEKDRGELLQEMIDLDYKIIISCVDTRWLDEAWVGRNINSQSIAELHKLHDISGLDICGENGEYHTLVTAGPLFVRNIAIRSFTVSHSAALAYMKIQTAGLAVS